MADFCKIDFNNLNEELIDEYNDYVSMEAMDEGLFDSMFSDVANDKLTDLKNELFQDGKWQEINEEFIKNHTVTENKEDSPENSGDPSLDQYNESKYNAETLNSQKVIISRFITSTFILGRINEEFRDWLFRNCIYDYDGEIQVANPNEVSERITNYKIKLCEELISLLGLDVEINTTTDENLTKSIQDVLNAAESKIQDESSDRVKDARKAFYKLVYFDDMLKSLDFVERDSSVPSYKHKKNMYTPRFGNDNMRKSWSQDETTMDMDEITSNFTKEFMNYLPLVNKNGDVSKTMKVGWNGFQRSVTTFMNWVKESLDPGTYEKITNGDLGALNTALENYLSKGTIIGSIYNEMINSEVLRSLQHFIFNPNSSVPKKIQNLFFTQVLKTAKHAYLGYDYDSTENTINLNLIEDKAIRSESSHLTNIIVSRIKTLRQSPELREKVVGASDSKFTDVKVDATVNPGVYTLSFTYNSDSEPAKEYQFIINQVQIGSGKNAKTIWKFNVANGYNIVNNSDSNFKSLIYDLFGYNLGLPETTEDQEVVDSFINETLTSGKTLLDIFSDPIGITLLGAMSTLPFKENDFRSSIRFPYMGDIINLKSYFKNYDDLAKFQYWCSGYDNKNVVRDIKGDKIPVYALISAIFQYDSLLYKANEAKGVTGSVYQAMATTNPLLNGDIKAKSPLIRNGIATSLGKKTASQMTTGEYIITSAFIDYGQSLLFDPAKKVDGYRAHRLLDGNTVMIQFTVFSDKSQQFVIPFTFGKNSTVFKSLKALAKERNEDAEKALATYIYNWQRNKYLGILNNIASKYSKVYDVTFKPFSNLDGNGNVVIDIDAIEELNNFIKDKCKNKEILREDFKRAGVNLTDEIDFSSGGLNTAFIEKLTNIFNSQASTEYYLEKQKRVLIQDLVNNNVNLYDNAVNIPQISEEWKDNRKIKLYKVYQEINGKKIDVTNDVDEDVLLINGEVNPEYSVELNPILNSWLYADGICSQSYEEVFFGINENNPNKSKGDGESRISGRLLAHYKRTVPAGSTVHLYMQGLDDGVPQKFRAAVIDDLDFAYATNSIGEVYTEKPHDGGAWCNPYYAIWARNSLGSAAAGTTMAKTIHHDVDEYGNGILCKWATYTITNAIRRNSQNSAISMEKLHKKMNNVSVVPYFTSGWFNAEEALNEILKENGEIWVNDIFGKPKKIVNIKVNNDYGTPTITVNYSDVDGKTSSKTFGQEGLTIYDLDQVFGGAWIQTKQNGALDYAENLQNEMVIDFLTKASRSVNYDIKEKVVSYLINTSAIKRGAVNVNEAARNYDDEEFSTMMISTKYGGLMMDSEHDVDGHVREMSQIMSSLVQNGYSEAEAKKIYSDIGRIIEATSENLFDGTFLSSEERKKVIERMLVRALKVSKTGGIGASDAIVLYANKEIKDKSGKVLRQYVPFSLSDIKSKFQATVNAYLTNEALIRKYPGLQAVNTPSRGIIQYYKFNNGIFNYESAVKWVLNEMTPEERFRLSAFFDEQYLDYNDETVVRHAFNPYRSSKTYELFNRLSYFLGKIPNGKISYLEFRDKYGKLPHGLFEAQVTEEFPPISEDPKYVESYKTAIAQLYELSHTSNPEMITDICEGQFLKKIWDPRQLQIGQSILVRKKGDNFFRKITLESAYQRDLWVNLEDPNNLEIYRLILAPEDLKQPQLQFEFKSTTWLNLESAPETKTEWDLDVVRAMYYFREIISKDPNKIQFYDKKVALIDKVLNKIINFGNQYNFSRHASVLNTNGQFTYEIKDKTIQGQILKVLRAYQQEIYYQLKQKGTLTSNDQILGDQEAFNIWNPHTNTRYPDIQTLTFKEVTPGEIAVSAAYAKEFMIKEGDDLGQILREGANFFRRRLWRLNDVSNDLNPDQYDAVLIDKLGNQVVVKVVKPDEVWNPTDENGEPLFYEDGEGVDRQAVNVLYNGNKICSNDDWDAKKIKVGKIANSQKGKPYKIIVLQDINDLKLFEDSSQFISKETLFNFTENNVKTLFSYAKDKLKKTKQGKYRIKNGIHYFDIYENEAAQNLNGLRSWQEAQEETFVDRRADLLAKNFEKTLLYFGTRIPSQAMQSGMSLKVTTFVGNGGNQVFIPGAMHWFEGADYDIDKTYMMRLGLNNGYLDILSDLYEDFGDKCSKLSLPNKNISYEVSTQDPNLLMTEVRSGLENNNGRYFYNGVHYVNASALMESPDYTSNNDEMFKSIKKILNDSEQNPGASKNIIIVNDNNYDVDTMEDISDLLDSFLKKHNATKMNNNDKVSVALMNRNVLNAYDIFKDPVNFISASDPISFGEIKEYAKKSSLGGREKYVSIWNGSSKGIMQEQFMLGKDEIGIIATAIKSYLQKTNVVNAAVLRAADAIREGDINSALDILSKYCFTVKDLNGTVRLGILANINFRPLYEAYASLGERGPRLFTRNVPNKFNIYANPDGTFNFNELLDNLSDANAKEDVLMALSALLSAATDNAKELILSKINASQSTIDLFCSMLGTGYSIKEILDVFSSPWFTLADTLMKNNLYAQSDNTKTLTRVIDFITGNGTLLSGKYQQRFIEMLNCEEFLYKTTDSGNNVFRFDKPAKEYYDKYLRDIQDPDSSYKGNKDSKDPVEQKSTMEKRLEFANMLLIGSNYKEALVALEDFYNKVEAKEKALNNKKRKAQGDGEDDIDDYSDLMQIDEEPELDGFDGSEPEFGDESEPEPDIDDPDNYVPKKTRIIKNLTFRDFTLEDVNTVRAFLDDVQFKNKMASRIRRNGNQSSSILIEIKENVIPVSDENKILGKMNKCNQGLVSSSEDLYNFTKAIEIYFNNELRKVPDEKRRKDFPDKFNLEEFLTNEVTQNMMIELFDDIKHESNVLRMMRESDNFWNMFKIYKFAIENSKIQYNTDLTWKLINKVLVKIYGKENAELYHKVNSDQYKIINSVVSDALVFGFLKSLPEEQRVFKYQKGVAYYPTTANQFADNDNDWSYDSPITSGREGSIDIGTASGAATFKRWMDTTILHQLKEQFKDNAFIRNLHTEEKFDPIQKQGTPYLTVGIDMTNISNSTKLKSQFNTVKLAYEEIANEDVEFYGNKMKLKDMLYLYNLIQNKGVPTSNSFNALFGDQIVDDVMNEERVMSKHWAFLNDLDTLKTSEKRDIFESNFMENLVKDSIWRLASNLGSRIQINAQSEENVIKPITSKIDRRLIGYNVDNTSIYLIGGDFRFNLPFTSGIVYNQRPSMFGSANTSTHFFSEKTGSASRIRTKTFLMNALQRYTWGDSACVKILETAEDWANIPLTDEEKTDAQHWNLFAHDGVFYINMNTIDELTPARVLVPLMSIVANNYKDKDGKLVYKDMWNNLLRDLKNSQFYDSYYKKTFNGSDPNSDFFKSFAGTSADELVLATYITDQLITDGIFESEESKSQTNDEFNKGITTIVNRLLGLKMQVKDLPTLSFASLGQIIKGFGTMMPAQGDFKTAVVENANMRNLIRVLINDNKLKISGNC